LYDDRIEPFLDEGFVTDIIRPIQSGKEAEVFLCRAAPHLVGGEEYVVAKLHRQRHHRAFHNDARYQEGRFRKVTHEVRAMEKKNRVGREIAHGAWIEHEWNTLRALHSVGADVPRPIARAETGLLMAHVGDGQDTAPQLKDVRLEPEPAAAVLERLLWNLSVFLAGNLVHADLSAYNVLWLEQRITVIDFPQAVDARFNPNAREFLGRDVRNICAWAERSGVVRDAEAVAADLWTSWEFADLVPEGTVDPAWLE
jgi:RIO kinase 1